MSISISIVAQRSVTAQDHKLIEAYNTMCDIPVKTFPADFIKLLKGRLGNSFPSIAGEKIYLLYGGGGYIEVPVHSEGDVMYGDGAIVLVSDLPEGTDAIRIFAT